MAGKERKIINHPFLNKHTIIGVILLTFGGFVFCEVLMGGVLGTVLGLLYMSINPGNSEMGTMILINVISILSAFVLLAIFWRWFYPEYEGGLKGGRKVVFWTIISIAIVTGLLIVNLLTDDGSLGWPSAVNIATALMAGVCEEAFFRGIGASYLMRQWRDKNDVLKVMIVTSLLFAVIHCFNMIGGAPLAMTIVQIINAFSMGCLFCGFFLRSGNLIPAMVFHTLNDVFAFMRVDSIGEGGIYNSDVTVSWQMLVVLAVLSVIYISITLFLTRPSVRDELRELWDHKWVNPN